MKGTAKRGDLIKHRVRGIQVLVTEDQTVGAQVSGVVMKGDSHYSVASYSEDWSSVLTHWTLLDHYE